MSWFTEQTPTWYSDTSVAWLIVQAVTWFSDQIGATWDSLSATWNDLTIEWNAGATSSDWFEQNTSAWYQDQ